VSWLTDLLDVYGRVLRRAVDLTVKHWWLGLIAIGYFFAFWVLAVVVAPFGLAGGLLLGFAMAALISSWLALVDQIIRHGRVTLSEISESFLAYVFDVITVMFVRSLFMWAAMSAFGEDAGGAVTNLTFFVFLNAAPEEIYLARNSGPAVFVESVRFIANHWIEWVPINVIFAVLLWAVDQYVPVMSVAFVLLGVVLTFGFVARGLLFLELTTSSRRAREFARRAAG
jgi:hypothetical protein